MMPRWMLLIILILFALLMSFNLLHAQETTREPITAQNVNRLAILYVFPESCASNGVIGNAFTDDSQYMATRYTVYALETGQIKLALGNILAISPNGRYLITEDPDALYTIDGERLKTFEFSERKIRFGGFSPDSSLVVLGDGIFDPVNHQYIYRFQRSVRDVFFSSDSQYFTLIDGNYETFRVGDPNPIAERGVVSRDGRFLADSTGLIDLQTNQRLWNFRFPIAGGPFFASFSANNQWVANPNDGVYTVDGQRLFSINGTSALFSDDGQYLVTFSNHEFNVYLVASGEEILGQSSLFPPRFIANTDLLIVPELGILNLETRAQVFHLPDIGDRRDSFFIGDISPDGRFLSVIVGGPNIGRYCLVMGIRQDGETIIGMQSFIERAFVEAAATAGIPATEEAGSVETEIAIVATEEATDEEATAEYTETNVFTFSCPVYEVRQGDIPAVIAQGYGVSVDALLRINGLTESSAGMLQIGQRLFIPLPNCIVVAQPTPAPISTIVVVTATPLPNPVPTQAAITEQSVEQIFRTAVVGGRNYRVDSLRECSGDPGDYEVFVSYDLNDPLHGSVTTSAWYLFFPPYDINSFIAGRCN